MLLLVPIGTFIESWSASHLIAGSWTYDHPAFSFVFLGFFLNILVAALLRYPYRRRHVPFLIAHLGLLAVFGGVIIKKSFGLQGSMRLIEGSMSSSIAHDHDFEIAIESNKGNRSFAFDINERKKTIEGTQFEILSWFPHTEEKKEAWIAKGKLHLQGFPPLLLQNEKMWTPIPLIFPWQAAAIATCDKNAFLKNNLFKQGLILINGKAFPLSSLLEEGMIEGDKKITADLQCLGKDYCLKITKNEAGNKTHFEMPLSGNNAFLIKNVNAPHLGSDLILEARFPPTLFFIRENENNFLIAVNEHMGIASIDLDMEALPLFEYDKGFLGYTSAVDVPSVYPPSVYQIAHLYLLVNDLFSKSLMEWPLPLQWLHEAAKQEKCPAFEIIYEIFLNFQKSSLWIAPAPPNLSQQAQKVLHRVFLNHPALKEKARFAREFFLHLPKECIHDQNSLIAYINNHRLPFNLKKDETLVEHLFSITETLFTLPSVSILDDVPDYELFSALLRLFRISLNRLTEIPLEKEDLDRTLNALVFRKHLHEMLEPLQFFDWENQVKILKDKISIKKLEELGALLDEPLSKENFAKAMDVTAFPKNIYENIDSRKPTLTLESPLIFTINKALSNSIPEESRPGVRLKITSEKGSELLSLSWKKGEKSFKKRAQAGEFLLSLRPKTTRLPLSVSLKEARINDYPGSSLAYSYEADVIFQSAGKELIETTLSMNEPVEIEGFRFYLAGISRNNEGGAKKIHLVVSSDPAKYLFTYPGCLLVSLGSLLLLFRPRFLYSS